MRQELEMKPGKLASQVAHAARMSLLHYLGQFEDPRIMAAAVREFLELGTCGTISVIQAEGRNQVAQLEKAAAGAGAAGLPVATFVDSGHVCPPHFDGGPVMTGVAIGPATKKSNRDFTKKFDCVA